MNNTTKYTKCYKLPWSEFDNPNGWIEPTTFCNISCPGCYRGLDIPGHKEKHLDLDDMKKQVDWFIANRNIHTLSIAGGEPLMYPHIKELIEYAASRKLRVMLYTNAYLLTRELAETLANSGLTQLVIHVDRFQSRPDLQTESSMELKLKYVEMLKDIAKLQLGFIQPISSNCEDEVADLMRFLKNNYSAINLMVFTLYRNICESPEQTAKVDSSITVQKLIGFISKYGKFKPTAYLGSENNDSEPTWLFSQTMGINNKIFGSLSSSFYKFAQTRYRKKKNKYLFISKQNVVKIKNLLKLAFWISISKILLNYFFNGISTGVWNGGKINFQTILILRGPEKQKGKWDLCAGCPDRMIYKNKLVPSCILENLKDGNEEEFKNIDL